MKQFLLIFGLLSLTLVVNNAFAQEQQQQPIDYLKKFSDYVNSNSGYLFWTGVGIMALGIVLMFTVILALLGYPLIIMGVIIMIVLLVNWLFISPITH